MGRSRDRSQSRHRRIRRSRSRSPKGRRRSRSHSRNKGRHRSKSPHSKTKRKETRRSRTRSPKRASHTKKHETSSRRSPSRHRRSRSRSPQPKRRSPSRGRRSPSRGRRSSPRSRQANSHRHISRSPDKRRSGDAAKNHRSRSAVRRTSPRVDRIRSQSMKRPQVTEKRSMSPLLVPYRQPSPAPLIHRQPQYRELNQSISPPTRIQTGNEYIRGRLEENRMSSLGGYMQRSPSPQRRRRISTPSPPRQRGQPESVKFVRGRLYVDGASMMNTKRLLTDRHITASTNKPFIADDNITIGIRRHGPHLRDDPTVPINRHFESRTFDLMRRSDEGQTRLFDREEIKMFHHDDNVPVYEERRVISVIPSSKQYADDRITERSHHSRQEIRLIPTADPRYESLLGQSSRHDVKHSRHEVKHPEDRITRNPNDLRNSLTNRRPTDDRVDARRMIEQRRGRGSPDRRPSSPNDRRRGQSPRDRRPPPQSPVDKRRVQSNERVDRFRRERIGVPDNVNPPRNMKPVGDELLPDFSKRPGKYTYEEWQDNPLMIPKNESYFEHDNRDGEKGFTSPRGRGRGRGGFRGRGRFRGIYQGGRGMDRPQPSRRSPERYRSKRKDDTWDHDMFKMMEREDDMRPTSTTN